MTSDASGRFVMPGVDELSYMVVARGTLPGAAGELSTRPIDVRVGEPMVLRLGALAAVEGHVSFRGGDLPDTFDVCASQRECLELPAAAGTYRLDAIEGLVEIQIVAEGFGTTRRTIEARPGRVARLDFALSKLTGLLIEVSREHDRGRVAGALVTLDHHPAGKTDAMGVLHIPQIAPGEHQLVVSRSGHRAKSVSFVMGSSGETVAVALLAMRRIRGTLVVPSSCAPRVEAVTRQGPRLAIIFRGAFFVDVPESPVELTLRCGGMLVGGERVDVPPEGRDGIVLEAR